MTAPDDNSEGWTAGLEQNRWAGPFAGCSQHHTQQRGEENSMGRKADLLTHIKLRMSAEGLGLEEIRDCTRGYHRKTVAELQELARAYDKRAELLKSKALQSVATMKADLVNHIRLALRSQGLSWQSAVAETRGYEEKPLAELQALIRRHNFLLQTPEQHATRKSEPETRRKPLPPAWLVRLSSAYATNSGTRKQKILGLIPVQAGDLRRAIDSLNSIWEQRALPEEPGD